jgi:D-glycero-alpha-D-manno-heptose-7-phosphate kinase
MLISSAPLRFSLNGGGSDLPSFLEHTTGLAVSMPLDKRVYITMHQSFFGNYRIAYSRIEEAQCIEEIKHPIVRASLELLDWKGPGLEITSIADVPSNGTGLGSSSAFTVALISGILQLQEKSLVPFEIAKLACEVEIEILKSPIGYQDQYGCAMADLNAYSFFSGGRVEVAPIFKNPKDKLNFIKKINDSLLFFRIDRPRSANTILYAQQEKLKIESNSIEITKKMVNLANESILSIQRGDLVKLGRLMTLGWSLKSELNGDNLDTTLTALYEWSLTSPIHGAKLLGAGGGGFLAVLAEKKYHQNIIDYMGPTYKKYDAKVKVSGLKVQEFGDVDEN